MLTFWELLFVLVLASLCEAEASLAPPSCSMTRTDLFAMLGVSRWLLGVGGTLESSLRSIFTSRDLDGLWESRELLAVCPVLSELLRVVLRGVLVPLLQTLSGSLLPLILSSRAGSSWSGRARLWGGQEQGIGYCTPHDGQWPHRPTAPSGSSPAFRLSSNTCLEVRFPSLLASLLSLLFLLRPVFVLTLGLSVKQVSLSCVATTSSHFTTRGAALRSGQAAASGIEEFLLNEGFLELLQLLKRWLLWWL